MVKFEFKIKNNIFNCCTYCIEYDHPENIIWQIWKLLSQELVSLRPKPSAFYAMVLPFLSFEGSAKFRWAKLIAKNLIHRCLPTKANSYTNTAGNIT